MTERQLQALLDAADMFGWNVIIDDRGVRRVFKDDAPSFMITTAGDLRDSFAKRTWARVIQYSDKPSADVAKIVYSTITKHKLNPAETNEVCKWAGIARPLAKKSSKDMGTVNVDIVPSEPPAVQQEFETGIASAKPTPPTDYVAPFHSEWHLADETFVGSLIAKGGNFRKPAKARVGQYAEMMIAGRWAWTMEPWCVSSDGRFIQGMHRAHAALAYLAAGGKPQIVEVRWDCPAWWGQVMDAGAKRTAGQRTQALGHAQATSLSVSANAVYNLANNGHLNNPTGQLAPPTMLLEMLGTAEEPTRAANLLHDGFNLAKRVEHGLTPVETSGYSCTTVAVPVAFGLMHDDDWTRTLIEQMVKATQFAPRTDTAGAEGLMAFYRTPRHISAHDRSRYDRRHRMIMAFWETWRSRGVVTFEQLKRQFLTARDEALAERTRDQWAKYRDEMQAEAIRLTLDDPDL